MEFLANNKIAKKLGKRIYRLKKNYPFWYSVLDWIADGMVLGSWMFLSVGVAFYLTANGYTPLDSALMGVALVDVNVLMFTELFCSGEE